MPGEHFLRMRKRFRINHKKGSDNRTLSEQRKEEELTVETRRYRRIEPITRWTMQNILYRLVSTVN